MVYSKSQKKTLQDFSENQTQTISYLALQYIQRICH